MNTSLPKSTSRENVQVFVVFNNLENYDHSYNGDIGYSSRGLARTWLFLSTVSRSKWNLECWEEDQRTLRKTSEQGREPTKDSTHMLC